MFYGYGFGFNYVSRGLALDPDAQAFITAASITDPTQQSAVNQLVLDLKSASLWTKMKAVYPFVGGSAASHKWNLKDPRDLDAAFRLVFFGGVTHDSNGVTGNGTNGYFNTFVNPSVNLQLNNTSVWTYSRTQLARDGDVFLGTLGSIASDAVQLTPRNVSNFATSRINSTNLSQVSNSNSQGLFGSSRLNSSSVVFWIRGIKTNTLAISTSLKNENVTGLYFQASGIYSQRNIAFSAIGDGLTDTEAANFYTAVQAFQTTLSRSV